MENKTIDFKREAENAMKSRSNKESVEKLFDDVCKMVKDMFVETGQLLPCVHLMFYDKKTNDFKTAVFPMLASNDQEKYEFSQVMRKIIEIMEKDTKFDLLGVITIFEVYVARIAVTDKVRSIKDYAQKNNIRASEHPDKVEALSFTFEQEFTSRHLLYEFIKSGANNEDVILKQEPMVDHTVPNDENLSGGSFSFLFTKKQYSSN